MFQVRCCGEGWRGLSAFLTSSQSFTRSPFILRLGPAQEHALARRRPTAPLVRQRQDPSSGPFPPPDLYQESLRLVQHDHCWLSDPQHLPQPCFSVHQASGMYAMCTRAILARPKATGTFASYPTDMLGKKQEWQYTRANNGYQSYLQQSRNLHWLKFV